jgi:hypothetical protein
MALRDPVAVYNAANNSEVYQVQDALAQAGIEAYVTEENSGDGLSALGITPELHTPQVWVERRDVERVQPILVEFERRNLARNASEKNTEAPDIRAECEDCGRASTFPGAVSGSVQQCAHCGAYMDVGEAEEGEEWESEVENEDA